MSKYTDEQVAALKKGYDPEASQDDRDAQVAVLAAEMGVSTRSVIAKLTNMGVYVPKVYQTKTGETPVKKDELVSRLEVKIGKPLDGLEKATKRTILTIIKAVDSAQEVENS